MTNQPGHAPKNKLWPLITQISISDSGIFVVMKTIEASSIST